MLGLQGHKQSVVRVVTPQRVALLDLIVALADVGVTLI